MLTLWRKQSLYIKLSTAVVAMFAFGFLLVPLYDVFCDISGINGKTNTEAYQYSQTEVDKSRKIKIQLVARNHDGIQWHFKPEEKILWVHPGELKQTRFFVENNQQIYMIAQAIPSVSPGKAAAYFQKTACFCFEQQPLAAGEQTAMPLVFVVDKDLPQDIKTITLAYTLFDVTEKVTYRLP